MLIVIQLLLSALFTVTELLAARQCQDGQNFPDPNNCKNFFRCIYGKKVLQHCGPGTYWEQEQEICEYDPNEDCKTVAGLQAARQCQDGQNFPDPNNCKNFFRCIYGKKVLQHCGPGTYWEQEQEICEWDRNVDCKMKSNECQHGQTFPDPNDCANFFRCIHGKKVGQSCTPGTNWNQELEICASNVQCKTKSNQCQHGQTFPDPNDCANFFRCMFGKKVPQSCTPGTNWNQELEICAPNVRCTYVPIRTARSTTKSNQCQHGQTFPDPNDCANFFRCMFGKKVPQSCTPGTNWNQELEICASNVRCKASPEDNYWDTEPPTLSVYLAPPALP